MEMESGVDITKLIRKGGIYKDVEGSTPKEIYENVTKLMDLPEGLTPEIVTAALCAREEVLSTAVGNGIALPHARAPIMKTDEDQRICVVYLKNPIDMKAPDERSVHVMFILLTHNPQVHLEILSSLAGLFRNLKFRKALEVRSDEATLSNLIREIDK